MSRVPRHPGPYRMVVEDPKPGSFTRRVFDWFHNNVDPTGLVNLNPLFFQEGEQGKSRSNVWAIIMYLQRAHGITLYKRKGTGYYKEDGLYEVRVLISHSNLRWFQ